MVKVMKLRSWFLMRVKTLQFSDFTIHFCAVYHLPFKYYDLFTSKIIFRGLDLTEDEIDGMLHINKM